MTAMAQYVYQHGFSERHHEIMYNADRRGEKAKKVLAVLTDYLAGTGKSPADLSLLDIGCSTGFMTRSYGKVFASVVGIDIDQDAVGYAKKNNGSDNVSFSVGDSMALEYENESFDCVTCTHIYEHVPDAGRLMAEVYRVLRPGGCCYFAAGNRFTLIEPHYRLPLLSAVPKIVGNIYVRSAGRADHYYENLLSLWGLKKLVQDFEMLDYTPRIIADPARYHATNLIRPGSIKHRMGLPILRIAYWLCPTYIWILSRPETV